MSDEKVTPLFGKSVDQGQQTKAAAAMQWTAKEIAQHIVEHGQPIGVAMVLAFEDGFYVSNHVCLIAEGEPGPGRIALCSAAGALLLDRATSG